MLWAIFGYLLGAIPSGVIVARAMNLGNLRDIGSGNIGATNVLRTGNKRAAALTLIGDALKGAVAVMLARAAAGNDAGQIAGLAAFLGHCFPVWLAFRGGKGVATFLGITLALSFVSGLIVCAVWLVTAAVFRISSLAALVAAIAAPMVLVAMARVDTTVLAILLATLVFWRHSANIARLNAGTEPRIGRKP